MVCSSHLGPLWDSQRFWYTDHPSLTPCFEKTVLIWIPSVIFLLVLPFYIWQFNQHRKAKKAAVCFLCSCRRACMYLLCLLSIIRLIWTALDEHYTYGHVDKVEILSLALLSECFFILALFSLCNWTSTAFQWITIACFAIFGLPELCSKIIFLSSINVEFQVTTFDVATYFALHAIYILCLTLLSLRNWHSYDCLESIALISETNVFPERRESWFSRIYFIYTWRLLLNGCKKILSLSDIWTVDEREKSGILSEQLMKQYEAVKEKYKHRPDRILTKALLKIYWKPCLSTVAVIIIRDITVILLLLGVKWLIWLATHPEEPRWHGIVYLIFVFLSTTLRRITYTYQEHMCVRIGLNLKCALSSFILKKSLKLSPNSRRQFSPGEITNLVSVDAEQFLEQGKYIHILVIASTMASIAGLACAIHENCEMFLQIGIIIYMMYDAVGHACWPGLFIFFMRFLISWMNGKYYKKYFGRQMVQKDERMRVLVEMLKIMKVVKLYAWELAFKESVERIRKAELDQIRMFQLFSALGNMVSLTANPIALVIILTTVVYGFNQTIKPDMAIQLVMILWFFAVNMDKLPLGIVAAVTMLGSLKRLGAFFAAEELEYSEKESVDEDDTAIRIESGEFSWNQSKPTLDRIDLDVNQGSLVAIIGQVGSGKSSLLSAIAGEMYKCSGDVKINGTLAYVPQQSWILNDTLRGNVLFNKHIEQHCYENVINACALKPDLELLPAGDMTEIGERGVNLSGGQKQRISMARAVCQNNDIYLLDDPLSAVDVKVQKQLFDEVIGPNGLLQNKTRILVTHALSYLPLCDKIVVMQNGRIIDCGTFHEISRNHWHLLQNVVESAERKGLKSVQGQESFVQSGKTKSKLSGKLCEDEIMTVGQVAWSAYWLYFKFAITCFSLYLIFLIGAFSCNMTQLMWLQNWLDKSNAPNGTGEMSNDTGLTVLGGIVIAQFILSLAFVFTFHAFIITVSRSVHEKLLIKVLRAPITFFDTTPIGRIVNRFSQDIYILDVKIPICVNSILVCALNVIIAFIPAIYASPIIAAFMVPVGIIFILIQRFYLRSATQLKRLEAQSRSPIYSQLHDVLQGPENIRIYGQQRIFTNSFNQLMDTNAGAQMSLLAANRWLSVNMDSLGNFIIVIVAAITLYSQNVSPSLVALAMSLTLHIPEHLRAEIINMCEMEAASVSLERINEYLCIDQEADWTKSSRPSNVHTMMLHKPHLTDKNKLTGSNNWPHSGEIQFIDYCLTYRPDLPYALDHLNFKVPAGQKVGIVGRTGAGKTSLTLALFRLIEPAEGSILIDSVDITTLGLHELRSKITIIPQDPSVFNGTIRKNLDPFNEHTDDELWTALELSHLKSFVASLLNGLDHKLDEGGSNLSVGQRQLLCLSRALLKKSKILVLDEATASVDLVTDQLIQESIRTQFSQCTVITIAHRLETIMDYDRIIVMSNGRIIEDGSVDDLLALGPGHLRELAISAGIITDL